MSLKDLQDELQQSIQVMLAVLSDYRAGDRSDDVVDEYDFWFDKDTVVYDTDPDSDTVDAVAVEDLDLTDPYLKLFLNKDIISTYLSSGDFALIIASSTSPDGEIMSTVAAVDRTTGVGLANRSNLFDAEFLKSAGEVALANKGRSTDYTPVQRAYFLITYNQLEVPDDKIAYSRRRLTSLLTDIDVHVLSRYLDTDISVREDL